MNEWAVFLGPLSNEATEGKTAKNKREKKQGAARFRTGDLLRVRQM